MKEIAPTEQVGLLLGRYRKVGGVIEHVFIDSENDDRPPEAVHRDAALLTLRSIARGIDGYFERLLQTPNYRGQSRSRFFTMTIEPDLLTGRGLAPDDFVGPRWDRKRQRLMPAGDMTGYAHAFFDPPYGLYDLNRGISEEQQVSLFRAVTDALFAGFPDAITVYAWSTECSNYFDAGREYWGSFFWTVQTTGSTQLVGVAASTTD